MKKRMPTYLVLVSALVIAISAQQAAVAGMNPTILRGLTAQNRDEGSNIKDITVYAANDPAWETSDNGKRLEVKTASARIISIALVGPLPKGCVLSTTASNGEKRQLSAADSVNGLTMVQIKGRSATLKAAPIDKCSQGFPKLVVIQSSA